MGKDKYRGIGEAMRNVSTKSKPTRAEVEADILEGLAQGATQAQVAQDLGVSQSTVSRVKHKYQLMEQHEAERDGMDKQLIVAGDKKRGQLTRRAHDTNVYEGTCRLRNGKFEKKRFTTVGDGKAKELWEAWCEEVRAKDAPPEPEPFAKQEDVIVDPNPNNAMSIQDVSNLFPIMKRTDPKELAKKLMSGINAEKVCMDQFAWSCLCAYLEELEYPKGSEPVVTESAAVRDVDMSKLVDEACESDIPLFALSDMRSEKDVHISSGSWNRLVDKAYDIATGAAAVAGLPDEMYVTWMADKGPHALFTDMETATKTVDTLNSALEFAGIDKRYEVMDVKPWKEN